MDFEETGSAAAGRRAAVMVAGQDLATGARRDGCRVAAAWMAHGGIAAHPFGIGAPQLTLA